MGGLQGARTCWIMAFLGLWVIVSRVFSRAGRAGVCLFLNASTRAGVGWHGSALQGLQQSNTFPTLRFPRPSGTVGGRAWDRGARRLWSGIFGLEGPGAFG